MIVYFEFTYLPFTTECYYIRGHVIYDNPCLALSTVLESLGLVVLASLFSNKRAFLVAGVLYFGFPLLMGVTSFDRALAGMALILSVLFVLLGSPELDFKVALKWVLGVYVYVPILFFLGMLPVFLYYNVYPPGFVGGLLVLLFFFSPLLWKYRGCRDFFAFSCFTYVVLYFVFPGLYLVEYEAFLSLVGLILCLKGGVGNGGKAPQKS